MVSGRDWPGGDPNLQKQNEPTIAVSTRNPLHLVAGANDYRTLDFAGLGFTDPEAVNYDAWVGLFKSFDGGQTWRSTLLPGCSWALSNPGSPCLGSRVTGAGMTAGADPTVRSGANGMFFYSFIAFDRQNRSNGAVVVARLIDDNNREGSDTIRYLDDSIVDRNTSAQFADKPYLAVDIPRAGGGTCIIPGSPAQSFPAGNVYIAYTLFLPSDQNVRSKVMFAASRDCGRTWQVTKLSETSSVNQGASVAVDPGTGAVYVAWRRFKNLGGTGQVLETDNILVAKSVNGGQQFTKGFEVMPGGEINPFDQNTSATSLAFRTNSLPAIAAVPGGKLFLAWSQNGAGTYGDARVVMSSSIDGMNWTLPVAVDNHNDNSSNTSGATGRGHQIMPALTSAGGKLMLAYYDLRDDHTQGRYTSAGRQMYTETRSWSTNTKTGRSDFASSVFTPLTPGGSSIADAGLATRHTMDVRVLQLDTNGTAMLPSAKVSQYAFGQRSNGSPLIQQLEFNPPNLKLFRTGTTPFVGDFLDIAAVPFLPLQTGGWGFNASADSTVFHTTWTDNRNVRPGDPSRYAPPRSSGGVSQFDGASPKPACVTKSASPTGYSYTSSMNQDIYTARIDQGLMVGALGNAKGLSTTLQRSFPFFVKNTRNLCKSFRLTIVPPAGATASLRQSGLPLLELRVTVGGRSAITRAVYVTGNSSKARLEVRVEELQAEGCAPAALASAQVNPSGVKASILLNLDVTNPEIENTNPVPIANAEVYNPEIENPEIENPEIENPEIENPEIENPEIENPEIENPEIENPEIENPEIENPEIENPEIENPEIENPEIENIPPNGQISDVSWKVTNKGNTTASYNARLLLNKQVPAGFKLQLIVNRLYKTPVAGPDDCTLREAVQRVVLTNVPSPVFSDLNGLINPEIENSALTNSTFTLAPGETAYMTLRILDPDKTAGPNVCKLAPCASADFDPKTAITAAVAAQEANINPPANTPPPIAASGPGLSILTTSMSAGAVAVPYSAFVLASSGIGTRTWSISSGALPNGLSIESATGRIYGTPVAVGTGTFTVRVQDSATPTPQVATRTLSITIAPTLSTSQINLVFTVQPSNAAVNASISPAVQVQALQYVGGAFVPAGGLPVTITLGTNPTGAVLSGTTTVTTGPTGHAAFADLRLNKTGSGYTLIASGYGAVSATSAAFNLSLFTILGARRAHTATLMGNGDILLTGGSDAGLAPTGNPLATTVTVRLAPDAAMVIAAGPLMNAARVQHGASLLPNGNLLITGGRTNTAVLQSAEIYNGTNFTPTGSMVAARFQHTSTLLPDGRVLLAGGEGVSGTGTSMVLSSAELYVGNVFQPVASSMNSPRVEHTATLLPDGTVLLVGGYATSMATPLSSAETYAPVSSAFSPAGPMTSARWGHTSTLLSTGKVLIAGGYAVSTVAELYDPSTRTFATTGAMTTARVHHTATVLPSGKVLIAGGQVPPNGPPITSMEIYDPATGLFTPAGNMAISRYWHSATLSGSGQVLLAGGRTGDADFVLPAVDSGELYQPSDPPFATAGFSPTGAMTTVRLQFTGTLLPDGRVLAAGGRDGAGVALNSMEIYSPATGVFTPVASLVTARYQHAAVLLPNGKVLICGGTTDGSTELGSAELYDPATNTVSSAGNMVGTRRLHTATLMRNGKVLIAGDTTAEIYDPVAGTFGPGTFLLDGFPSVFVSHKAVLLPDGKVLLASGTGRMGRVAVVYDPAADSQTTLYPSILRVGETATAMYNGTVLIAGGTYTSPAQPPQIFANGTFTTLANNLNLMRESHSTTALPNGRLLIAGGADPLSVAGVTASAELFTPGSNTFAFTSPMGTQRQQHAAVLLPNGKVLVFGGRNNLASALASAELYTPGP